MTNWIYVCFKSNVETCLLACRLFSWAWQLQTVPVPSLVSSMLASLWYHHVGKWLLLQRLQCQLSETKQLLYSWQTLRKQTAWFFCWSANFCIKGKMWDSENLFYSQRDGWIDRQAGRQTDRQADRQTDRQTDRLFYSSIDFTMWQNSKL